MPPKNMGIHGDNIKFKYIVLKNPHDKEGFEEYKSVQPLVDEKAKKKIERVRKNNNFGKIRIELHDFMNYFESYEIID